MYKRDLNSKNLYLVYFTVKEGLGIEDAERVFEEFERDHYAGWDLKIFKQLKLLSLV